MSKIDPITLAEHFMNLNDEDFRMFWAVVAQEWNHDDSDIDAQWFYTGKTIRPTELTVIGAMHSALLSGRNSARSLPEKDNG